MKNTLLIKNRKNYFIKASVKVNSPFTLEETGDKISKALFASNQFEGIDENKCEEVPSIFLRFPIFGLDVVLQGYGDDEGYFLDIYPNQELFNFNIESEEIDISLQILTLIEKIPILKASLS